MTLKAYNSAQVMVSILFVICVMSLQTFAHHHTFLTSLQYSLLSLLLTDQSLEIL